MSSPPKANHSKDAKRVPMACTNCRQKKLKVHYRITLLYVSRSDCTRTQCRAPDETQRECPRCIENGLRCEYVPVNPPSTPNTPHHDPPLFSQPLHRGSQSLSPPESTRPGYYTTQPNDMQWNLNIDPSLMGPQGIVPNPPATGGHPLGQPPLYPPGSTLNPSAHAPTATFPPQSLGHQGPYLSSPEPWGSQHPQYSVLQATSPMGRPLDPYGQSQSMTQTGVVWSTPTGHYQYPGYTRPSGDQQ